jgi:hypothetical protein
MNIKKCLAVGLLSAAVALNSCASTEDRERSMDEIIKQDYTSETIKNYGTDWVENLEKNIAKVRKEHKKDLIKFPGDLGTIITNVENKKYDNFGIFGDNLGKLVAYKDGDNIMCAYGFTDAFELRFDSMKKEEFEKMYDKIKKAYEAKK